MVKTISKISIPFLILLFVLYIVLHIIIGYLYKGKKEELEMKPGNQTLESETKFFNFLNTWFPAVYVVIIIIILYLA